MSLGSAAHRLLGGASDLIDSFELLRTGRGRFNVCEVDPDASIEGDMLDVSDGLRVRDEADGGSLSSNPSSSSSSRIESRGSLSSYSPSLPDGVDPPGELFALLSLLDDLAADDGAFPG